MPRYFFHFFGQQSARNFFSEPYASEHEAKENFLLQCRIFAQAAIFL
jgi:hypothetical protein